MLTHLSCWMYDLAVFGLRTDRILDVWLFLILHFYIHRLVPSKGFPRDQPFTNTVAGLLHRWFSQDSFIHMIRANWKSSNCKSQHIVSAENERGILPPVSWMREIASLNRPLCKIPRILKMTKCILARVQDYLNHCEGITNQKTKL